MSRGQVHVGVQGCGQAPQKGDGGLGAALFDALNRIEGYVSASGELGDAEAQGAALVIHGLAEGQGLADGDPLRILGLLGRESPAFRCSCSMDDRRSRSATNNL